MGLEGDASLARQATFFREQENRMFSKKRYVLVCTNEREPGNPKGCCAAVASREVRERIK